MPGFSCMQREPGSMAPSRHTKRRAQLQPRPCGQEARRDERNAQLEMHRRTPRARNKYQGQRSAEGHGHPARAGVPRPDARMDPPLSVLRANRVSN